MVKFLGRKCFILKEKKVPLNPFTVTYIFTNITTIDSGLKKESGEEPAISL